MPGDVFSQVNLAHQGMGDVMGGILADCLVGLPLMRELNLRDNRLTDKGLIPIVKVNCRLCVKSHVHFIRFVAATRHIRYMLSEMHLFAAEG